MISRSPYARSARPMRLLLATLTLALSLTAGRAWTAEADTYILVDVRKGELRFHDRSPLRLAEGAQLVNAVPGRKHLPFTAVLPARVELEESVDGRGEVVVVKVTAVESLDVLPPE